MEQLCLQVPDMLAFTLAVRRLLLCEELERSSCGSVLFHGYLPPPGTIAHVWSVFKKFLLSLNINIKIRKTVLVI